MSIEKLEKTELFRLNEVDQKKTGQEVERKLSGQFGK